jgi:peptidoglycan/LPS O-acetylase OafA/YrhL
MVHQLAQMPPTGEIGKKINRAGHWLAASSYSLYLSHFVVLQVLDWKYMEPVEDITLDNMFALLWVIILCQVVAFTIYMLSEMHTDLARHWLRKIFPARREKKKSV